MKSVVYKALCNKNCIKLHNSQVAQHISQSQSLILYSCSFHLTKFHQVSLAKCHLKNIFHSCLKHQIDDEKMSDDEIELAALRLPH